MNGPRACISTYNVQTDFELVVVQLKMLLPSQSIPFKPVLVETG